MYNRVLFSSKQIKSLAEEWNTTGDHYFMENRK